MLITGAAGGIGAATASSIAAFAYNEPTVFIETNIRAVFIHFFFKDHAGVHDRDLLPLIAQSVDKENPRQGYYALMDYGVMLKKEHKNPSRRSVHHVKQSKFEGSDRQVRGAVIRLLTTDTIPLFYDSAAGILSEMLGRLVTVKTMEKVLSQLIAEHMIISNEQGQLFIYEASVVKER